MNGIEQAPSTSKYQIESSKVSNKILQEKEEDDVREDTYRRQLDRMYELRRREYELFRRQQQQMMYHPPPAFYYDPYYHPFF